MSAESPSKATFRNSQGRGSKAPSTTLRTRYETVVLAFVHPTQGNALKSWLIRFGSAATAHTMTAALTAHTVKSNT
jgi:hypothetical protein